MRNKLFLLMLLCLTLCLAGCGKQADAKLISVTLENGEEYTLSRNHFDAERGSDITVELRFREGFTLGGLNYESYSYDGSTLTLHNVRYPAYITIQPFSDANSISYDLNGGAFIDGREGRYLIQSCESTQHLRANTSQGTEIGREGYTLTGWNTAADGTGEHIGLGSRVTLGDSMCQLYAEWIPFSPSDSFSWKTGPDGVTLTDYRGEKNPETLCLPGELDGKPVTGIAEGFCSGVRAERLVLPRSIVSVADGAFTECAFRELFFSDLITDISDRSFVDCEFVTLRLNAATPPRYQKGNEIAWFADMMDRLQLCESEKKLILFGGCSLAYGIDSPMIDDHFGGAYTVLNMGIIGGTNAVFQLACITGCLHEGDILIHAPEAGSGYQLYYLLGAEHRMFQLCEGNYDLLAAVDLRRLPRLFKAFATYSRARLEMEAGSYDDCSDAYNDYGDIKRQRKGGVDRQYTEGYGYATAYITQDSIATLCGDYQKILDRGARVFFAFSPVNRDGLSEEEVREKSWEIFEQKLRTELDKYGIPVLQHAEDYLLPGRYFYDTDYHLTTEGAKLRTERLLEGLDAVLDP